MVYVYSFIIYLRSSITDLNFTVLASSDDDIASLKRKAEAHHLALFPQNGRIVAQAFKIMREGIYYYQPDNIPLHSLFDGYYKRIKLLYMDAVTVPLDSAETHTHVFDLCQKGDPSRSRDLIKGSLNQWGNTSCTSESLKRKSPEGNTNKDSVVKEVTPGVGVLGEFVEGNTKKKKSKDPSSDEVPPSSERDPPKTRDRMQERSASPENETAGAHLMSGSLGTWNQGETSSLAPSGINLEDGSTDKIKSSHPTVISDSLKKLIEGDITFFCCRRAAPQFKNPLSEKQKFVSKDHLRAAVNEFHILNKFEFKWTHSDKKRMTAKCKSIICDWSLSAKAVGVESTKLPTTHGCIRRTS
ncbi:MuDR family transposase [Carex littledalei]|uniref:MuDR family transposase n=1 Tax=Carex littledalei TaxID=544730 RepID=A0A833VII0_9POAL|nr:MuDR family transposase [Carex littledalei]